jgi:hypothetical protein
MKQFWDDIISYLTENLNNDADFEKEVKVDYANNKSVIVKPPHIFVFPMQDTDAEQYDSFTEGENISYCPVQIAPYCPQMKIKGVTTSAQEVSMIFADKISRLFDKKTALSWNKNIVRLRRVGESFGMPVEGGTTTYTSPLRYEFYIQRNYEKIY